MTEAVGWIIGLFVVLVAFRGLLAILLERLQDQIEHISNSRVEQKEEEEVEIEDYCPCGAHVKINSEWDDAGQETFKEWLNQHAICREAWAKAEVERSRNSTTTTQVPKIQIQEENQKT